MEKQLAALENEHNAVSEKLLDVIENGNDDSLENELNEKLEELELQINEAKENLKREPQVTRDNGDTPTVSTDGLRLLFGTFLKSSGPKKSKIGPY